MSGCVDANRLRMHTVEQCLRDYDGMLRELEQLGISLSVTQGQMDEVLLEQDLIARGALVLNQVKPLLSASSIKQCEDLANSAISSVFGFPYTVKWDVESKRFLLDKGDFVVDLAEGSGGGMVTVVSFVFTLYLLVKLGKRKFMAYDEAFTQVSAEYFPNFIAFVRTICRDLGVDLLLISHDQRIDVSDVDTAYRIENGKSIKLK